LRDGPREGQQLRGSKSASSDDLRNESIKIPFLMGHPGAHEAGMQVQV
jgi:hypothetical protein